MRPLRLLPILFCASMFAQAPQPRDGFIPDGATAVRVGEAILGPIYGVAKVKAGEPYTASLHGEVWVVLGSTCNPICGGRFEIDLNKGTGAVLSYKHLYQ